MPTKTPIDGNERSDNSLTTLDYFTLQKHYAATASSAKQNIWNVTRWILALNAAMIAYCFAIYLDHSDFAFLVFFELVFCEAGLVLCWFTIYLIGDH